MKIRRETIFFNKINPRTGGSSSPRRTPLPKGAAYISHNNIKQKIRNLKKECQSIYKLKDEDSLNAIRRVTESTNTEYSRLMLMYTALELSKRAEDVSWSDAMNVVLDKIEEDLKNGPEHKETELQEDS